MTRGEVTVLSRLGTKFQSVTDPTTPSGVGSNLQVGCEAPPENFLMCPLTFLLCPHIRGHNDCLLPTERQLKC